MTDAEKIDLCPETELIMMIAWRDCLSWSLGSEDPSFVAQFEAETGNKFPAPAMSPVEAMIDQATGINEKVMGEYVKWFNVHVWGERMQKAIGEVLP